MNSKDQTGRRDGKRKESVVLWPSPYGLSAACMKAYFGQSCRGREMLLLLTANLCYLVSVSIYMTLIKATR